MVGALNVVGRNYAKVSRDGQGEGDKEQRFTLLIITVGSFSLSLITVKVKQRACLQISNHSSIKVARMRARRWMRYRMRRKANGTRPAVNKGVSALNANSVLRDMKPSETHRCCYLWFGAAESIVWVPFNNFKRNCKTGLWFKGHIVLKLLQSPGQRHS